MTKEENVRKILIENNRGYMKLNDLPDWFLGMESGVEILREMIGYGDTYNQWENHFLMELRLGSNVNPKYVVLFKTSRHEILYEKDDVDLKAFLCQALRDKTDILCIYDLHNKKYIKANYSIDVVYESYEW